MKPKPYDVTLTFTPGDGDPTVIVRTVDASSPVAAVGLAATQVLNEQGTDTVAVPHLTECHAVLTDDGVPA